MATFYKVTKLDGENIFAGLYLSRNHGVPSVKYEAGATLEVQDCDQPEFGACGRGLHVCRDVRSLRRFNGTLNWRDCRVWIVEVDEADVIASDNSKTRVRKLRVIESTGTLYDAMVGDALQAHLDPSAPGSKRVRVGRVATTRQSATPRVIEPQEVHVSEEQKAANRIDQLRRDIERQTNAVAYHEEVAASNKKWAEHSRKELALLRAELAQLEAA